LQDTKLTDYKRKEDIITEEMGIIDNNTMKEPVKKIGYYIWKECLETEFGSCTVKTNRRIKDTREARQRDGVNHFNSCNWESRRA
jgi:hypothetical protein